VKDIQQQAYAVMSSIAQPMLETAGDNCEAVLKFEAKTGTRQRVLYHGLGSHCYQIYVCLPIECNHLVLIDPRPLLHVRIS
jgi:hypothetical protein